MLKAEGAAAGAAESGGAGSALGVGSALKLCYM